MTLQTAPDLHVAFVPIWKKKKNQMNVFLKHTNNKKNVQANKQLYLFTLHCELKPYAALKGVPLPNGPRGDEGVN